MREVGTMVCPLQIMMTVLMKKKMYSVLAERRFELTLLLNRSEYGWLDLSNIYNRLQETLQNSKERSVIPERSITMSKQKGYYRL